LNKKTGTPKSDTSTCCRAWQDKSVNDPLSTCRGKM